MRIRMNIDCDQEMFADQKRRGCGAGAGRVMLHLEKKGEYAVIRSRKG